MHIYDAAAKLYDKMPHDHDSDSYDYAAAQIDYALQKSGDAKAREVELAWIGHDYGILDAIDTHIPALEWDPVMFEQNVGEVEHA